MNARRIAALFRELADAFDEPAPIVAEVKPRRRPLAAVPAPPVSPEVLAKVQRAVRRLEADKKRGSGSR